MDYWEKKLRAEAFFLRKNSLKYFNPSYMSLSNTHPLFTTCSSSPYETSKAVTQARFLSGRARVESLTKHWDMSNREGICSLCRHLSLTIGTVEHLLLSGGCPALAETRLSLLSFFQAYLVPRTYLFPIFQDCWEVNDSLTMQLLLDCSVIPRIIVCKFTKSNIKWLILHDKNVCIQDICDTKTTNCYELIIKDSFN